jgi:hypothetical protein
MEYHQMPCQYCGDPRCEGHGDELVGGLFDSIRRVLGIKVFTVDDDSIPKFAETAKRWMPGELIGTLAGIEHRNFSGTGTGTMAGFCRSLFKYPGASGDETRVAMVQEVAEYLIAVAETEGRDMTTSTSTVELRADCVVRIGEAGAIMVDVYLGDEVDPIPKPALKPSELSEGARGPPRLAWLIAGALSRYLYGFFGAPPKSGISIYRKMSPRRLFVAATSNAIALRKKLQPRLISALGGMPRHADPGQFSRRYPMLEKGRMVFHAGIQCPPPIQTDAPGFAFPPGGGTWSGKHGGTSSERAARRECSDHSYTVFRVAPHRARDDTKNADVRTKNVVEAAQVALKLGILYHDTDVHQHLRGMCAMAAIHLIRSGLSVIDEPTWHTWFSESQKDNAIPTNLDAGPVHDMLCRYTRMLEDAMISRVDAKNLSCHMLKLNGGVAAPGGMMVLDGSTIGRANGMALLRFGISPEDGSAYSPVDVSKIAALACTLFDVPVYIAADDAIVMPSSGIGTPENPDGSVTEFVGMLQLGRIAAAIEGPTEEEEIPDVPPPTLPTRPRTPPNVTISPPVEPEVAPPRPASPKSGAKKLVSPTKAPASSPTAPKPSAPPRTKPIESWRTHAIIFSPKDFRENPTRDPTESAASTTQAPHPAPATREPTEPLAPATPTPGTSSRHVAGTEPQYRQVQTRFEPTAPTAPTIIAPVPTHSGSLTPGQSGSESGSKPPSPGPSPPPQSALGSGSESSTPMSSPSPSPSPPPPPMPSGVLTRLPSTQSQ